MIFYAKPLDKCGRRVYNVFKPIERKFFMNRFAVIGNMQVVMYAMCNGFRLLRPKR